MLVLAAVTAVIASGFLFRSAQEAKLATRSFYQLAALNLAEAGIEEGLHAANSSTLTTANGWTLISGTTADYSKTITTGFNFVQATGSIYIRVDSSTSFTPVVLAAGVVTIPNQPRIVKQLRVAGAKRRIWANTLVSKGTVTFSGSASVDSYDSSLGAYNAATNRSDQATVATNSTAVDPIVIGSSAVIYGYVATGGSDPVIGGSGRIYGTTTPVGTLVDAARIRRDFTANLPDVTAPTGSATSLSSVSHNMTLPRSGDSPGANGRYLYTATSIQMDSNDTVKITGPVDLIVTGNVSITGTAGLVIGGTGSVNPSLNLYSSGSIEIGGSASVNATNSPAALAVWGTATSAGTQDVRMSASGDFYGTIYAPNGTVTLAGNGSNYGAVIAKTAVVSGSGNFHYDIQLGFQSTTLDVSFRPTAWCELVSPPGSGAAFARDNRTPFTAIF